MILRDRLLEVCIEPLRVQWNGIAANDQSIVRTTDELPCLSLAYAWGAEGVSRTQADRMAFKAVVSMIVLDPAT